MLKKYLVVGFALGFGQAFADSKSVNLTIGSSSQVAYSISSGTPSASDSSNTPLSGTIGISVDYPTPAAGTCPEPTSMSFSGGSMTVPGVSMALNWMTQGTYNYLLTSPSGYFTGSNMTVSGGAVDLSSADLEVTGGAVTETGTGTLGSGLGRSTSFATSPRTYGIGGGSASLTVTPVTIAACAAGTPYCHTECKFTLSMSTPGSDTMWSTPVDIGLGWTISLTATGNAAQ
jgi:hypothetical protein